DHPSVPFVPFAPFSAKTSAGCARSHSLGYGTKGLDQSVANSLPQNLHIRAVATIGSRQYGQGARPSAGPVAIPGVTHAQTSAATQLSNVQPRSRFRTKMARRLWWHRAEATNVGMK